MASGYGSWVNHSRYRWDLSYSPSVTASTSSVNVRLRIWYETDGWRIDDPSTTLTVRGSFSTSQTVYINLMTTASYHSQLIYDKTTTFSTRYGSPVVVSFSASHSGAWNNMNPSASGSISIPARPYSAPALPSNVSARRVNDSQVTVSFTAASSTPAPVTSVLIQRSTDGGAFTDLATVNGSGAKTFTDSGVGSGHYYQYRAAAKGYGGTSAYVNTATVYTTPLAPSSVSAVKSGMDIALSWTNAARGNTTNRIYENDVLIANLSGDATSFLIAAPNPTLPHSYSVVSVSPDGLESAKTASNLVQLALAPHAPTGLSPNSTYISTGENITLGWRYNSADTSSQSRFEIQTSNDVTDPNWVTLTTRNSSTTEHMITAGTVARSFLWRVRTWGHDQTKPSPYSEPARIDVVVPPTITITTPTAGAVIDKNTATINFTTTTSESPLYWQAELIDGTYTVASGSGSFVSKNASWNVTGLENAHTYSVKARCGGKVWSNLASRSFNVIYAAPSKPSIHATYQHSDASVQLEITNPAGEPAIVYNIVQRSHGAEFYTIAENVQANTVLIDHTPPLDTDVLYRVVAVSSLGTQSISATERVAKPKVRGVWLNWGIDGSRKLHLQWDVPRETKPSLVYASEYVFAGHKLPTLVAGEAIRRETTISAYLGKHDEKKTRQAVSLLEEAAIGATPVIIRRSEYASLSGYIASLSMPMDATGAYTVNFTHIQTDNQP